MITTNDQLRAAAERLGADVHDLQTLFPARVNLSQSADESGSQTSTSDTTSLFHTEAINNALDQSLFAICERAFAESQSPTTSPSSSDASSQSPKLPNRPRHPDTNCAASASSSPSRVQHKRKLRAKSRRFALSRESPSSSDDDSFIDPSQAVEVTRADARVNFSQTLSNTDSEKQSTQQSHNRNDPASKEKTFRSAPIDAILSFARGKEFSLVDLSSLSEQKALRKMRTLAIIPGCEKHKDCCVFKYLGALFKSHLTHVQNLPSHQNSLIAANIDTLKVDTTDSAWRTTVADFAAVSDAESCPPMISKTMDLFDFSYRLIGKTSGSRGFLRELYSSGTPKLVASLTAKLLAMWSTVWSKTDSFQKQSFLMEKCIRLLVDFIVYELSPVSQMQNMTESPLDPFIAFNLGREGLPVLSTVVDFCFQYVTSQQVGKDCRTALCELVQAFLIWRTCPIHEETVQGKLLLETRGEQAKVLDSLVTREEFWSIVVQAALQNVKKQPQLSDSCFEYSFLSSLVNLSSAKRALFDDKQEKSKGMLLDVMIRNLELMNRDLLSYFLEAETCRGLFPRIHTSIEFIHGLITSAAIQREILSADPTTKGKFLSSLVAFISNSAKLARNSCKVDDAMKHAVNGPFAKVLSAEYEPIETGTESEDSRAGSKKRAAQVKSEDQVLAREKAVAFAAKVIGCLGKSVENGSWDMSQMNSIKALFHARINSSRARHRLWSDIYKIQRGVTRSVGKENLLSVQERNSFAMVVEVVRKHATSESTDYIQGVPEHDNSSTPHAKKRTNSITNVNACLPPVWDIPELQQAVCSATGQTDFDNNHDFLVFAKDVLKERGEQSLALYEPESSFTFKWIRLQRRNVYIDQARELLDKSDRTVGQRCSCVPGYPKENGNGNESRVACSNDLCENRHMKIECVPGNCGAGSYCMNQRMQNLDYAKFKMKTFQGKGVGIVADEEIPEGGLVGEYQGEVVSMKEYERRAQEYEGERHFYFMTLTNKLVIDASRKSQATRFLNHSCNPNCETQKWNADGEPRVGIFAKRIIRKGEEITFDYGARSLTQYSARCLCRADNCRGFLAAQEKESHSARDSETKGLAEEEGDQETISGAKLLSGKQVPSQGEDRRSSIVREKLERARSDLREADLLAKKLCQNPSIQPDLQLNDEKRQKLTIWKADTSKRPILTPATDEALTESHEEVRYPRIPRRTVQYDKKDTYTDEKRSLVHDEKTRITKQPSASREAESQLFARTSRSFGAGRQGLIAGRWALFEETSAGRTPDSRKLQKRKAEVNITHRASKVPRAGFLPTSSKLKKQTRRPKFAKRKSTREENGNDSMAEYSTASEAEPILDEPILSPSRLPDGNGACSDDEFIAAPPVETLHCSPYGRQWNRPDPERVPYDRRGISREKHGLVGEQTRGGWRSRLGTSHRSTLNKSGQTLRADMPADSQIPLPGTYERFRPTRVEVSAVVSHEPKISGPAANQRRYAEYGTASSTIKENRLLPHANNLGHRQQDQSAGNGDNCILHQRERSSRPGGRTGHLAQSATKIKPESQYGRMAQRSHKPTAKKKRFTSKVFAHNYTNEEYEMPGKGGKDLHKSVSSEPMRSSAGFRSSASMELRCPEARRKEDIPGTLHGNGTIDNAYREKTKTNEILHVAKSHDPKEKPFVDQRSTHNFGKETGWERNARRDGRVDLRHVIQWRVSSKKR